MPATPFRKLSWLDWVVIIFFAIIAVGTLSAVLQQRFEGPAVQIERTDGDAPLMGCPGEMIPIQYRTRIAQVPTAAERSEAWWNAATERVLIPARDTGHYPIAHPIDRVYDDETIVIPTRYVDPHDHQAKPILPGLWEYRRSITALTRGGVYRTSVLVIPVVVRGDC